MTEDPDGPVKDPAAVSDGELNSITAALTILDEFLRSDSIAALLAAHLRATGHDHPGYDAALLIDQISFTAHALRSSVVTTDQSIPVWPIPPRR